MKGLIYALIGVLLFSCSEVPVPPPVESISKKNSETVAVIEIPAGTLDKFELDKKTNTIEHEHKNGKPRVVQYLAYPGNYGYIPGTLLSKENGGDGDALDVLVLGAAVTRKDTLPITVIGALKLIDRGEQDDKLIAVSAGTPFENVADMIELEKDFPGVLSIIDSWFTNYKGKGKMATEGFINASEAMSILKQARADYLEH